MGGTALSPSGTRLARTEMECGMQTHQPQTEAANAARAHVMRGVLSPSGTRLAPTEATRRPVACYFERPEQLQTLFVSRETFPVDNQQTGVIIGDTGIVRDVRKETIHGSGTSEISHRYRVIHTGITEKGEYTQIWEEQS